MSESRCPWCMEELVGTTLCPACGHDAATYEGEAHHLPPGALIGGRYVVGRVLGQGGFGITYIGYDTNLRRRVAIKEYFPIGHAIRVAGSLNVTSFMGERLDLFEEGRDSFLSEARAMARVSGHGSLVAVSDYFEANGTAYIIMDYVEGQSLADLATQRGGRIPFDELMDIVSPVMEGLGALHDAGLVHRDISPDNIMVSDEGTRLIDFGCARDFLDPDGDERTMTVMLKYDFAAPEQYGRSGQGPWTDVYGLCATMYWCLCGEVPPRSIERMAGADIVEPSELGVELPQTAEQAILRGLEPRREDRQQTMAELAAELSGTGPVRRVPGVLLPVMSVVTAAILIVAFLVVGRSPSQSQGDLTPDGEAVEAEVVPDTLTPERFQQAAARISAGKCHTLYLRDDDTVVSTKVLEKDNDRGQGGVGAWTDIRQVCCGGYHSVGVRSDGTVIACGFNEMGQCDVDDWTDIVQVSAGTYHTVGLKEDGTVVGCGKNEYGQCDVDDWTDIVQVSAGMSHTVGLRKDGTVVSTDIVGEGREGLDLGQTKVEDWTDIVQVSAGLSHTVGLRKDGTVVSTDIVAEGREGVDLGQTEVDDWTDVAGVSAGGWHTVGVRTDGTVVACGSGKKGLMNVNGWSGVLAACAGTDHTVALLGDSTLKATGQGDQGQCDVDRLCV